MKECAGCGDRTRAACMPSEHTSNRATMPGHLHSIDPHIKLIIESIRLRKRELKTQSFHSASSLDTYFSVSIVRPVLETKSHSLTDLVDYKFI